MGNLIQRLKRFWGRQSRIDNEIVVKELFKVHYWHFKSLLRLNERALMIVSRMEKALLQDLPFGMPFIRAHITSLSIHVYKIIQELNQLSDNRYPELFDAFQHIQRNLQAVLDPLVEEPSGPIIRFLHELSKDDAEKAGGKMAVLGEIKGRVYSKVPDGFVITIRADQRFMAHNGLVEKINQVFQSHDPDDLSQLLEVNEKTRRLIMDAPLPPEVVEALEDGCRQLALKHGKDVLLAVRSSAVGEDAPGSSFAGLYKTELNVPMEELPVAYKKVLAGKYTAGAISYRRQRGLRDEGGLMAVGCLVMVESSAGGVAYSRAPAAMHEDKLIINAVAGLGKAVVDGSVSPLQYVLEPGPDGPWTIVREDASGQPLAYDTKAVLNEGVLVELATLVRRIEDYFGSPQDVEWALDSDGQIIILQARPLQGYSARKHDDQPEIPEVPLRPLMHGGVTASPGAGYGPARLVKRREDMLDFHPGDVLVLEQALPFWLVLLKQASAVVADTGGMVGHFATVARELGVPALFNTHEATLMIADGQLITVDADGRKVFPGKVDILLQKTGPSLKPFAEDNPLRQTLKKVLQLTAPLNLTHPYESDFIPEKCLTYHDIIRFCHEKAMHELFSFGSGKGCLNRAGKRLLADLPLQFWIMCLDDENEEGPSEEMIRIDDIASPPFHAVWQGVTAVPWSGPPAPDMKGFLSVMAGSTMHPGLEVSSSSTFSRGNCAVVSRNFCNLSFRWGYHFSVIQAFWGNSARENYIRFQFQGGAADIERRRQRIAFIKEILEQYGFHVQVTHDYITAQLEGCEGEFLEKRLRLLGYVSLHSGQIDMIMGSPERAKAHKLKMLSDIRGKVVGE
ncbi:MAG: PEP/pyruvate-binding domain-containing protein [Thermodesulfobacteriota bacterium]